MTDQPNLCRPQKTHGCILLLLHLLNMHQTIFGQVLEEFRLLPLNGTMSTTKKNSAFFFFFAYTKTFQPLCQGGTRWEIEITLSVFFV